MSGKVFIDTNILIYAHNVDAGGKYAVANEILRALWAHDNGALSTQVLQEFYVHVTEKLSKPLSRLEARLAVEDYKAWCISTGPPEIITAFQIEDEARISFWDALILAAALKAGADRILSEDLNGGQSIAGIFVENPFLKT